MTSLMCHSHLYKLARLPCIMTYLDECSNFQVFDILLIFILYQVDLYVEDTTEISIIIWKSQVLHVICSFCVLSGVLLVLSLLKASQLFNCFSLFIKVWPWNGAIKSIRHGFTSSMAKRLKLTFKVSLHFLFAHYVAYTEACEILSSFWYKLI